MVETITNAIKENAVYDDDKDYDFYDSIIYESQLLNSLELIVREFAKTGYVRSYFMERVKSIADDEKLFKKRGLKQLMTELDKLDKLENTRHKNHVAYGK